MTCKIKIERENMKKNTSTFSLLIPLTISDILFSRTGSPCVLIMLPGNGGKFEASKSNFGVKVLVSTEA